MKVFNSQKFDSLEDLLVEQIQDLYDAEQRLVKALPRMSEAANAPELETAFTEHLRETEGHVKRLESAFQKLGREPERETCDAMKGLISEGEDMIKTEGDPAVRDAALIAAAQRIEHYEIAGYGTAKTFAQRVGRDDVANLLQETLDEESAADQELTRLAEAAINPEAARA